MALFFQEDDSDYIAATYPEDTLYATIDPLEEMTMENRITAERVSDLRRISDASAEKPWTGPVVSHALLEALWQLDNAATSDNSMADFDYYAVDNARKLLAEYLRLPYRAAINRYTPEQLTA